jgi:uncharacterized membrane protein YgdD (TMEM256/DUF423 family)
VEHVNNRFWLVAGAVFAGAAVVAGAIGTHFLKETLKLPADKLQTYDVAVRFQMYHALALLALGILLTLGRSRWLSAAGVAFLLGIVLFSGGIYAWLATDVKPLVHVVPVGGIAWTLGWLLLTIGLWRWRPEDSLRA